MAIYVFYVSLLERLVAVFARNLAQAMMMLFLNLPEVRKGQKADLREISGQLPQKKHQTEKILTEKQ